jgi:thioredoxin-related protein
MSKVTSISIILFITLTVCAFTSCGRADNEEKIRVDPRQQGELPEKQTMSSLQDLKKPPNEPYSSEYVKKMPTPERLNWVGLDQALQMIRNERSRTKAVVYFGSKSPCEACEKIEKFVFTDPQVLKYSKNWVFVRVDYDVQKNTAKYYHIDKVPAFKFLDNRGFAYKTFIGPVNAEDFAEMLLIWF